MHNPLNEQELRSIEDAAASGKLRDHDDLDRWVGSLLAEVRRSRSGAGGREQDGPHKLQGDALIDGSGSRHGADAAER